ncbi:SusD/RagB family nutrient-binding outer membrane lipoprotein [Tellurirhabdus rosea]|uniref:SusD/RagB family nutrient-binding outer membrane lipoprotein n=1 Tax=Tellurirhabdus rosea TaxID=2674997 RepID=UPI0022532024|nr:SusD/RagB family nutrient-binding outer membrane lipoprotein [Tellurirhabdus rosea]
MKPYKKLIQALPLAALLWSATGCSDFLETNVNPNLATSSTPNLLLTSAGGNIGYTMGSDIHRYTMLFSQQFAAQNGRQTEAYDAYTIQPTEVNQTFRANFYAGPLADLEQILRRDATATHPFYFGIAKVLKAFSFGVITDLWGDVPYTEAFKGTDNLQPKPDASKDIYDNLIKLIDEGIADLRKTSSLTAPAGDDYFYGGNAQRWIRLANTLKLRLYLHMLNANTVTPQAVAAFVQANEANFMASTADDFQLRFETVANKQNPIHQFILSRTDDIAVSATIVNLMNGKADPRRASYFTPMPFSPANLTTPPSGTTGYVGLANGTGNNTVRNNLSRLHTYVRGAVTTTAIPAGPNLTVSGATGLNYDGSAPIRMLLFSEYNFIRAELALRYGVGTAADAERFYQAGIRASFANAGVAAQADAYIARQGTLTGTPDARLRQIIEEKYVANYMVAVEPWNDWRRTGFPDLSKIPTSNPNLGNSGRVPRALPYPQQEVDANPNLKQRANGNLSERPVFWDTRTTGPQ